MDIVNSKIDAINSTVEGIAEAIKSKGVDVPSATPISDYPTLIESIQSGGGGGEVDVEPEGYVTPELFKSIFTEAKTLGEAEAIRRWGSYGGGCLYIINDDVDVLPILRPNGGSSDEYGYILSDSTVLEYGIDNHEWDKSKDIVYKDGRKIRWIFLLNKENTSATITLNNNSGFLFSESSIINYVLYMKIDRLPLELYGNGISGTSPRLLEYIDATSILVNDYQKMGVFANYDSLVELPKGFSGDLNTLYGSNLDLMYFCFNCKSLKKVSSFDCYALEYCFQHCYKLEWIGNINTVKTGGSNTFANCYTLKDLSKFTILDDENGSEINLLAFAINCYSLSKPATIINYDRVSSIQSMYENTAIQKLDFIIGNRITSINSLCQNMRALTDLNVTFTNPDNITDLRYFCRGSYAVSNVNFISELKNLSTGFGDYFCSEAYNLTEAPNINSSKFTASATTTGGTPFYNVKNLKLFRLYPMNIAQSNTNSYKFYYSAQSQSCYCAPIENGLVDYNIDLSSTIIKFATKACYTNFVNSFADVTGYSTARTMKLNSTIKNALSDEQKLILTNKGWTIA